MSLYVLDKKRWFPPLNEANADGLLAIGGDLDPERLLLAYQSGIFPWFEGKVPLWWSPDPRFVLFPAELKVSKSMQSILKKSYFRFTINTSFERVIDACQKIERKGQEGTWITSEMKKAYMELHRLGFAHSCEVWKDNDLVGGLYGIRSGRVFCGESMFSTCSNASKYAFINYVKVLTETGIELIDCQVYTQHLERFGARMVDREYFVSFLGAHQPLITRG